MSDNLKDELIERARKDKVYGYATLVGIISGAVITNTGANMDNDYIAYAGLSAIALSTLSHATYIFLDTKKKIKEFK
ncbi:hypothetical protein J4456_03935 [Candidatus Pacearchaeota archaeon]|nr:hypothetical protein [Candidatus Pacearchaeota archaeon]